LRNLRKRIERLEKERGADPVLILEDGTRFEYPGSALSLYMQVVKDVQLEGCTPLIEMVRRTVNGENLGLLWQVMRAALGPFPSPQFAARPAVESDSRITLEG